MRGTYGAEILLKLFLEKAAVRQAGQRIVAGKFACLKFCADARFDFFGKVSISPKCVYHHGDTHYEQDENCVVEFPFSVIDAPLKQFGSKIIGMGDNVGDRGRHQKGDGVSCIGPSQIKPAGLEDAC
jgi:hypothetical protein